MFNRLLVIFLLAIPGCLFAQNYVPFPTEDARWSEYTWVQGVPDSEAHLNAGFFLQGDTLIGDSATGFKSYSQVWYQELNQQPWYAGGLREDNNKGIWFYPASTLIPYSATFPSDSSAYLIYSFDNLTVGSAIHLKDSLTVVFVSSIDSIMIGSSYRKVYEISNANANSTEYWIEGIGSTKGLLFPAGFDYNSLSFMLCFENDSVSYHNTYNPPSDSCTFEPAVSTSVEAIAGTENLKIFPNPATESVTVSWSGTAGSSEIRLMDMTGRVVLQETHIADQAARVSLSQVPAGSYFLEVITQSGREVAPLIVR